MLYRKLNMEISEKSEISFHMQVHCSLLKCAPKVSDWWKVNFITCDGLVSPRNKPSAEPILTAIHVTIWCEQAVWFKWLRLLCFYGQSFEYRSYGISRCGRDKMSDILQTAFSNAFPWQKMSALWLRFHWKLFEGFQLKIRHHYFR